MRVRALSRAVRMWTGTLLLVVVLGGLCLAIPAQAAFPGKNGRIAFRTDSGQTSTIESIEPDGTGRAVLTAGVGPSWSPDGATLAFLGQSSRGREIFTIPAGGGEPTQVTSGLPPKTGRPGWSPDGSKFAFESGSCGMGACYFGLYVVNSDGSDVTPIESGSDPSWSPDGSKIVYYRILPNGANGIHIVNPDGTGLMKIADGSGPDWSPDGSKIVYSSGRDLYTVDADGTGQTRLTDTPASEDSPVWSPDGRKIAFSTDRDELDPSCFIPDCNFEIYTMDTDGTDLRNVTRSESTEVTPDWQPVANHPPGCGDIGATPDLLWPPNHRFRNVALTGATDPDGDAVTVTIVGVTQDEPVGRRPDARVGDSAGQIELRAQRRPRGDGRVYRISFTASDGSTECSGVVTVDVRRHKGRPAVDSAPPSYDSFGP